MKIAYFAHYFPPAGYAAAVNTYEIVKRLAARGHQVTVFTQPVFSKGTSPSFEFGASQPSPFKVKSSLLTPLPLSIAIPHAINMLKAIECEWHMIITQFHVFHLASLPGYVIKTLRKKPWIIKVHDLNPDPSLFRSMAEKLVGNLGYRGINTLGRSADRILIPTSELKQALEKNGHASEKITLIPHGVDTRLFSPAISEKSLESDKTILYIGAMRPQYGLDKLVKAFALLKPESSLRLMLVGNGPERPGLEDLSEKLGIRQRVEFAGYIAHDSLPEIIRNSYITVGPFLSSAANSYSIPTKVLEYFACGKTTVSSELSRDILINGRTGVVVDEITPKGIAEKLSDLIYDEKSVARLGKAARQVIEEKFDWNIIIDRLEGIIEDIAAHGNQ